MKTTRSRIVKKVKLYVRIFEEHIVSTFKKGKHLCCPEIVVVVVIIITIMSRDIETMNREGATLVWFNVVPRRVADTFVVGL